MRVKEARIPSLTKITQYQNMHRDFSSRLKFALESLRQSALMTAIKRTV